MTLCHRHLLRRWAAAVAVLVMAATIVVGPADGSSASTRTPPIEAVSSGKVLVSLTFDDGYADQRNALPLLAKHKMRATFYIIDGNIRYPAYLTWPQIRAIAQAGHEIGGHTSSHPHLTEISPARQRREVCDGRATLLAAGFRVSSFAYPYGDTSPAVARLVKSCGYTTARDTSGLVNGESCADCPVGNPLPLPDPFRVRANSSTTTVPLLKSYVQQAVDAAESSGTGTYVPLIFHRVCDPCTGRSDEEITPRDLDTFLDWLAKRPEVSVETVHDVVGGRVKPAVGTPVQATVRRALAEAEPSDGAAATPSPGSGPGRAQEDDGGGLRLLGVDLSRRVLLIGGGLVVMAYLTVVVIGTRRRRDDSA